ncbi:LysR substrate-binding domain-containing protein [Sphingomonas morindae]|uniref:LysR family transcriptional regulator n=1 Tax=Sphingomonas morindae TaxID=1541170 RepID=A0ABY4XBX5_9SPHN|nr:LysR substrate-binding domain-containing protein [Sphingomonas morindae]USI74384.1 LysR family transcriptional regulator [Sphingomonas morindae]
MRRLPPLTAVEAFVQVARLGSVKAAADELALSSPALSRRVQAMERFIGRPLFARRHQAMTLNADGERLLSRIAPALDALSESIEDITGEAESMRLRLGVLPLYASRMLIPRLPDLRRRHPSLHIDVDTAPNPIMRLGDGLDVAITLAHEIDPPLYGRRLGRNRIIAVASKSLIEGPNALREPADLARATVLLHREMPDNFNLWRAAIGLPTLTPATIDHLDSGQLILESAAEGLGVGFMLDFHLDGANDPRLVQLFPGAADSTLSYWFVCRKAAMARRPVRLFHDWLVDSLGAEA